MGFLMIFFSKGKKPQGGGSTGQYLRVKTTWYLFVNFANITFALRQFKENCIFKFYILIYMDIYIYIRGV